MAGGFRLPAIRRAMRMFTPRQSYASLEETIRISSLLDFWIASKAHWFAKDKGFDTLFRERFLEVYLAVVDRRYDGWSVTADGALALVILTDQFPRNAFRGTVQMYATDALARLFAGQALAAGHMNALTQDLRLFLCLPYAHSEDMADQDRSVALNAELGEPWLSHARGHREIIRRFGRFPHRNPVLGRRSTPAERAFLQDGGFSG